MRSVPIFGKFHDPPLGKDGFSLELSTRLHGFKYELSKIFWRWDHRAWAPPIFQTSRRLWKYANKSLKLNWICSSALCNSNSSEYVQRFVMKCLPFYCCDQPCVCGGSSASDTNNCADPWVRIDFNFKTNWIVLEIKIDLLYIQNLFANNKTAHTGPLNENFPCHFQDGGRPYIVLAKARCYATGYEFQ